LKRRGRNRILRKIKKMKEASPDHPLAMMFDDAAPSLRLKML
jgi:hypothetical protein